ncbi:MAG: hypothetical protein ACI4Q3_04740 [Kiritimatiellia bacterium]
MKKSMFALACAASIAVSADVVNGIGFEDYSLVDGLFSGISGKDDAGLGSGSLYWLYEASSGSEDGSAVKAFETAPTYSGVDFGKQYLELSTEGGTLWRSINTLGGDSEMALGTAYTVPDAGLYIDTMVQFTPTEDGGDPDLVEADKLAIWVDVTDDVTNLYVRAELIEDAATFSPNTFVLVPADGTTLAIDPSAWYRLTVKAETIPAVTSRIGAFQIFIDGQQMMAKDSPFSDDFQELLDGHITVECADLMARNCLIPSLEGIVDSDNLFTLTAVGFKGSGAIDNLSISETAPTPPTATIDFTITAADGVKVEWSVDGSTWTTYDTKGSAPAGTIQIRLTDAGGGVKIVSKTLSAETAAFDVSSETFGWPEYLGEAIDGAYVIDDQTEFDKFVAKVAALGSAGVTFKLAADVTADGVNIGAINAKDVVAQDSFKTAAFNGVFDGDGHTITVTLPHGDYVGLFGSAWNATIKNVKVVCNGFKDGPVAGDGGAALVGVSGQTTIENCEVSGTVVGPKGVAGLVGYCGGGTVLKGCVNNATIQSTDNEKAGGLIACAQDSGSFGGGIVVENCTNNGNITSKDGSTRASGLVSYTDTAVTFKGANVVKSTVSIGPSGQSIINLNGGSMTLAEGATFSVPANIKTVNDGKSIDGVRFATVDEGVATLVADSAAIAGASLKVMATGATVTLANVGDFITLDTNLATVTVTTSVDNAEISQEGNVYTVVLVGKDYPDYIADDEETKAKYDAWVDKYGVTDRVDAAAALQNAYLLNVAPADAEAAEAEFKITSITVNADGTVTVVAPTGTFNGTVEIKGSTTVDGTYSLPTTDPSARFFKAFLK